MREHSPEPKKERIKVTITKMPTLEQLQAWMEAKVNGDPIPVHFNYIKGEFEWKIDPSRLKK